MKYDSMLFHHGKRFMNDIIILLTFTNDLARKVCAPQVNGAKETHIFVTTAVCVATTTIVYSTEGLASVSKCL